MSPVLGVSQQGSQGLSSGAQGLQSWLCSLSLQGSHPCLAEALLRHRQAGHSTAVAPSRPARAGLCPISSTTLLSGSIYLDPHLHWPCVDPRVLTIPMLWRTASPVGCLCVSAAGLGNSDIFPAEKVSPVSHVLCHMLSLL